MEWRSAASPDRAQVSALVQSPEGTLFAGTGAGIFASEDLGGSWHRRGSARHAVWSLLVTQEGALLAGTYRQGILRSSDHGGTWTPVGFDRNTYVNGMIQGEAGRIYAAVRGSVENEPTGIFRSDDDGRTWVASGLADEAVYSITIPRPGVLFAGTRRGLFRSQDDGRTWDPVGELPSAAPVSHVLDFGGDLIAAMGAPRFRIPGGGLARSRDEGETWEVMSGLPPGTAVHSLAISGGGLFAAAGNLVHGGGRGVYKLGDDGAWHPSGLEHAWIISLLGTPQDLFAGAYELGAFHSDRGQSWAPRSGGLRNWVVHSLVLDAQGTLYALSARDLFQSGDAGRSWTARPRPEESTAPTPWSMALGGEGEIFLGGDGGIVVSESGGESWEYRGIPEEDGQVFAVTLGPEGQLFAVVPGEAAYRSPDAGRSWTVMDLPAAPVQALFPGPSGARFITTTDGFWRWTAEGSWDRVAEEQVWSLTPCGGGLVAGTFGRGLLRSTDDGRTWMPITDQLRARAQQSGYMTFTSMACLPNGGALAGTFWDGVFYSPDDGATWTEATGDLPSPTVLDLVIAPNGEIFASTPAGVFVGIIDPVDERER